MNNSSNPLDRLLRAAAQAAPRAAGEPSFALESRVLANWQPAAQAGDLETLVLWLRRATIAACLVAFITIAWNFNSPRLGASAELAAADSAMSMGVEP